LRDLTFFCALQVVEIAIDGPSSDLPRKIRLVIAAVVDILRSP
jgi:hypothetical protein